jgi:hypothetical protein
MASAERAARRFDLATGTVSELLLDFEAYGWVRQSEFAGLGSWALTEAGRDANEQQLADELDEADARTALREIHREFLPMNARFLDAVTGGRFARYTRRRRRRTTTRTTGGTIGSSTTWRPSEDDSRSSACD